MGVIKGQNFRVTVDGKIVAAATSCTMHLSASLEDSSTKDDTADWTSQECVSKSWDGSADALVIVAGTDETEAGLVAFDATELIGTSVAIVFEQTSGTQNRTATSNGIKYTGNAIVNDISISAQNKQNGTYTIQFTGVGALTKGTNS